MDEEDDDDDDEPEYRDNLRDLAKECFVKQDFVHAIFLLTDALKRQTGKAGAASVDIRDIQTQLVLCHLFQNEWRKAAPIVEGLAKGKGLPDEATCNLLHALSLAQLRDPQYSASLDNALKSCRRALRVQEKLIKEASNLTGGDDHLTSDYNQTLGLCATIHDMRDDPIRYSMCRKRLPPTFVYKHPASEVEYITNHPRLLSMILGEDAVEFWMDSGTGPKISEGVSEVDAGTMGLGIGRQPTTRLHRTKTSATSPLRTDFAESKRREEDSKKKAVSGPTICTALEPRNNLAPDENETSIASTRNISRRQTLKQRLTRLWTSSHRKQPSLFQTAKTTSILATTVTDAESSTDTDCTDNMQDRWQKLKQMAREKGPIAGAILAKRRLLRRAISDSQTVSNNGLKEQGLILSWLNGQSRPHGNMDRRLGAIPTALEVDQLDSDALTQYLPTSSEIDSNYMRRSEFSSYYGPEHLSRFVPQELDDNEIVAELPGQPMPSLMNSPHTKQQHNNYFPVQPVAA